jgi:hypothetical protein
MVLGKLSICIQRLHPCLSPCTNIKSKWIKNLNISHETLKLLQGKVGYTLEHIEHLNRTPIIQQVRGRIDKWEYMKLKSFCTAKWKWSQDWRDSPQNGRKTFASYTSDKGLITRIYRELKKLSFQTINDPMKKWANELNRTFSKEDQMAKNTWRNAKHLWP